MKKILYVTSVPWGWIKQRPQFLAESMSQDFKVDVFCKRPTRIKKTDLLNEVVVNPNLSINSFRFLPFANIPLLKHLPLNWINKILLKLQLPDLNQYDILWFTSPSIYNLAISGFRGDGIVVYDCMDDILEFPGTKSDPLKQKRLKMLENRLLADSDIVFCSAEYLKQKVVLRSHIESQKVVVVNNAVEIQVDSNSIKDNTLTIQKFLKNNHCLVYIGTIDKWFDFDTVLEVLNNHNNLHLVLIGPNATNIPNHSNIHYFGTLPHNQIFHIMPYAYALVMPFKLNELIRSVNPVKLYEYIYACVPVIATRYGETEKFSEFVFLYENIEDFKSIVKSIDNKRVHIDKDKNISFVQKNTWANRYSVIKQTLLKLFSE